MHAAVSNQSCYEHSVKMSRSWAKIVGVNSFWKQNLRNDIAKNRKAFFFFQPKYQDLQLTPNDTLNDANPLNLISLVV